MQQYKSVLKNNFYRYGMVTLACFIISVAINTFYLPHKLLSGGVTGFAVLGYYIAGLPIGLTAIVMNIPLFMLAYKYLDRSYIVGAAYGMFIISVFIDATRFLSTYHVVKDPILSCIAGGVLYGIGASFTYRVGGSTGGTDIIGAIIMNKFSISIGTTGFLCNLILLFISSFFFGIEPALYTLLAMFVMTKTCNAFVIGFDFKKMVMIISDKHEEIAAEIITVVGRGVTYLHAQGAYSGMNREVLMVVVKMTQLARIKEICKSIDGNAFLIIHDVNDVFGRGFTLKSSAQLANEKALHYDKEEKA